MNTWYSGEEKGPLNSHQVMMIKVLSITDWRRDVKAQGGWMATGSTKMDIDDTTLPAQQDVKLRWINITGPMKKPKDEVKVAWYCLWRLARLHNQRPCHCRSSHWRLWFCRLLLQRLCHRRLCVFMLCCLRLPSCWTCFWKMHFWKLNHQTNISQSFIDHAIVGLLCCAEHRHYCTGELAGTMMIETMVGQSSWCCCDHHGRDF